MDAMSFSFAFTIIEDNIITIITFFFGYFFLYNPHFCVDTT